MAMSEARLAPILNASVKQLSAVRAALRVAVELLADAESAKKRLTDQNRHLRAELRAYMSGRTIAEERQKIDREAEMAA